MIRSLPSSRGQLCPSRHILALRARAAPICHTPLRVNSIELSQQLVRRASSSPASPTPGPKQSQPQPKFEVPPRSIIYHIGTPRIMFLGALKLTTVFVFGFFAVVVIPSYVSTGQPLWQTVGLTAASTVPFLAVWYLTSPMAVWVQMRIPDHARRTSHLAARYLAALPADAELAITTMGALGKPRVSHVRLCDLWPTARPGGGGGGGGGGVGSRPRLGLVNYVRDDASVARENARRAWWMFRAVRGFRIEDETTTGRRGKYDWDGVARQIRQRARLEGL